MRVVFKDGDPYDGTVIRSYVTRPRKTGVHPERRIVVHYDDPRWQHETFEHTVGDASSDISLITTPSMRQSADRLERVARRAARLQRQLN